MAKLFKHNCQHLKISHAKRTPAMQWENDERQKAAAIQRIILDKTKFIGIDKINVRKSLGSNALKHKLRDCAHCEI